MAPMVNDASDDILFLILETFTEIIMVYIYINHFIYNIINDEYKKIYILFIIKLMININIYTLFLHLYYNI